MKRINTEEVIRLHQPLVLKEIRKQKLTKKELDGQVLIIKAIGRDQKKSHRIYGGGVVYGTYRGSELIRENYEWIRPLIERVATNNEEVSNG